MPPAETTDRGPSAKAVGGSLLVRRDVEGQMTIPIAIREQLGFRPGTEVEFEVEGAVARLSRAKGRTRRGRAVVEQLRGRATRRLSTEKTMALTRG